MNRTLFCLSLSLTVAAGLRADESRRLFDFNPIGPTNPVVAKIDDTIEIPLSELRGYRDAERLHAISDPGDLAQKRAVLDELIDEYLAVDEAYRTGVTRSAGFVRQMEATRTMILTDFIATRAEAEKKSATASDTPAAKELGDKLFEAATLDISNEAFAIVKRSAKAIDETSAAAKRGPVVDSSEQTAEKLRAIVKDTKDVVVVRYDEKTITAHQILVIYAGLPAPRPTVDTEEGFVAFIKPMVVPELMAIEAAKRGIAAEPAFQAKVTQNQNALLRFHMQGALEHRANEMMRGADGEQQLLNWFNAHKSEYGASDGKGGTRMATFAEAHARVEGDYSVALLERLRAEQAAALRKTHKIVISDDVLKGL